MILIHEKRFLNEAACVYVNINKYTHHECLLYGTTHPYVFTVIENSKHFKSIYFPWLNFARAFQNKVDEFPDICSSKDIVQPIFMQKV